MIIGHEKQIKLLKEAVVKKKLPHALLFSGQGSLGKKKVSLYLTNLLLTGIDSENGDEEILKKADTDFIYIDPKKLAEERIEEEKKIQKEIITISIIQEIRKKLSLTNASNLFKIVIIDNAHLMNEEAQDCFLKTLEEPRGKTLIILITEYPKKLFPTILSRVEEIKFYPLKNKEIEEYLTSNNLDEEKVKLISSFSLGKPGLAIDFLKSPEKLESWKENINKIIKISSPEVSLAEKFQYVEKIYKDPKKIEEVLNSWLTFFYNILLDKMEIRKGSYLAQKNKRDYSILKVSSIIKNIQRTSFILSSTNVSPRLSLEILLMEI